MSDEGDDIKSPQGPTWSQIKSALLIIMALVGTTGPALLWGGRLQQQTENLLVTTGQLTELLRGFEERDRDQQSQLSVQNQRITTLEAQMSAIQGPIGDLSRQIAQLEERIAAVQGQVAETRRIVMQLGAGQGVPTDRTRIQEGQ